MSGAIRQGLLDDGVSVPLTKLCRWLGVPRRTVHYRRPGYRPTRASAKIDPAFARPVKALLEQQPSFG